MGSLTLTPNFLFYLFLNKKPMRKTTMPIATFLAPSMWMDLSSGIIHKPKYDIFEIYP